MGAGEAAGGLAGAAGARRDGLAEGAGPAAVAVTVAGGEAGGEEAEALAAGAAARVWPHADADRRPNPASRRSHRRPCAPGEAHVSLVAIMNWNHSTR